MDNREFIKRCIVSSTAFTGHDGCLLIKELNEVYRKAELYDKIVESNSKSLVENGGTVNDGIPCIGANYNWCIYCRLCKVT